MIGGHVVLVEDNSARRMCRRRGKRRKIKEKRWKIWSRWKKYSFLTCILNKFALYIILLYNLWPFIMKMPEKFPTISIYLNPLDFHTHTPHPTHTPHLRLTWPPSPNTRQGLGYCGNPLLSEFTWTCCWSVVTQKRWREQQVHYRTSLLVIGNPLRWYYQITKSKRWLKLNLFYLLFFHSFNYCYFIALLLFFYGFFMYFVLRLALDFYALKLHETFNIIPHFRQSVRRSAKRKVSLLSPAYFGSLMTQLSELLGSVSGTWLLTPRTRNY